MKSNKMGGNGENLNLGDSTMTGRGGCHRCKAEERGQLSRAPAVAEEISQGKTGNGVNIGGRGRALARALSAGPSEFWEAHEASNEN